MWVVHMRTMVEDDFASVLSINQANVPEVGDLDAERLRHILDESAIALVAEHQAENGVETLTMVVGFCLILAPGSAYDSLNYRWFMEHHPASMYLDRVAFDEQFQGHGLGTSLYDAVEFRLRRDFPESDALTLEVNVDPPNEPSLRFHEKQGFSEVGRHLSHGIEVSLMRKPL